MEKLKGLDYKYKIVKDWLQNWEYETKKSLILHGTPGIGKTFLAQTLADELKYNLIEFNTSDQRNKAFMNKLKSIVQQQTFFPSIILLDEVDGVENLKELAKVLSITQKPIILTANDLTKLSSIRKLCKEVYIPKPTLSNSGGKIKDYRQSSLIRKGSQGYDPHLNQKNYLLRCIKEGKYPNITINEAILLLDSSPQEYGFGAYQLIKGLACFDRTKRVECLSGLKPTINEITEVWFSKLRYRRK